MKILKIYFYLLRGWKDDKLQVSMSECNVRETENRYYSIGKFPEEYPICGNYMKKTDIGKLVFGYENLGNVKMGISLTEKNDELVRETFGGYIKQQMKQIQEEADMLKYNLNAIKLIKIHPTALAEDWSDNNTFSIYQLKDGIGMRDYHFEPYKLLKDAGLSVKPSNYELIYTAELAPKTSLEDIFTQFNIGRPKDFKGHSLSVSDIVVLHRYGEDTAYYVDSFGYVVVPEFFDEIGG